MYSLEIIKAWNNLPPRRVETETTRHCSYNLSRRALILHSAKQRSTLSIAADTTDYKPLVELLESARGSKNAADAIIESYFTGDVSCAKRALARLRKRLK